ncbi:MAG: murein L,D-transpeptidase [Rhizobiales bacterium]|nr:murein L,D-transpeptidase [Hyphomicrobiales bacterium]
MIDTLLIRFGGETGFLIGLGMLYYLNPKNWAGQNGSDNVSENVYGRFSNLASRTRIGVVAAMICVSSLSACQNALDSVGNPAAKGIPKKLIEKMTAEDMKSSSPILLRIFKLENVMEVWKEKSNGRYGLLATYDICKWSGRIGPKFKEGDRQAPEGFYSVNKHQMNPNSSYHLSFNIGFPNAYDRSHKRTGTHLMVHGACASAGCYSMTDDRVEVIYALAREAFKGGQKKFQVQAFPFHLTPENMAIYATHQQFDFWKMLKEGYDHFDLTRRPVKINVCEKRYLFNRKAANGETFSSTSSCPKVTMNAGLLSAYSARRTSHEGIFTRVLGEEKLKAKENGKDYTLPSENLTLIAKGTEVLPKATPISETVKLVSDN